jgi:hypothetical protein
MAPRPRWCCTGCSKRCNATDHRLTSRRPTFAGAVLQHHSVLANQPASRFTRLSLLEGRRHTFPLRLYTTYTEAPAFFTSILTHQIGPPSQTHTCTETETPTPTATPPPTQQKRLPRQGRHSTSMRLPVELPRDPTTSIYQAPWQLANDGRAATDHEEGSVGRIHQWMGSGSI